MTRCPRAHRPRRPPIEPTFGQMFGFMLDSLFMDQLNARSRAHQPLQRERRHAADRYLVITPSRDVNEIARRHVRELPRSLAGAAACHGRAQCAQLAAAQLPAVRARLHPRIDRRSGSQDARARAEEIRDSFLRGAGAERHSAFCSESCRVSTCGCDLRKCSASCSAMYTERCWPPVQPMAMVR